MKISTTSIVLNFEKNRADKFSNTTVDMGDGSFHIPNWCSLKDTCNPNDTVVVQVLLFLLYLIHMIRDSFVEKRRMIF